MRRTSIITILTLFIVLLLELSNQSLAQSPLTPKRVGIINAIHDHWYESNAVAADDISSISHDLAEAPPRAGFRAIKVWPTSSHLGTDMESIYTGIETFLCAPPATCYEAAYFDVIALRPLENSSVVTETGCDGESYSYFRWENIDYGQVARNLYARYGHLDKVIILTGWEADNQLKGLGCKDRTPSTSEVDSFVSMLDARQQGVREAREANLGKNLRIYHAVEVSHVLSSAYRVIDRVVPLLAEPPDMISFSAWTTSLPSVTMTNALNHIESVSGLSRDRIFVGEWGAHESSGGDVYWTIYTRFRDAFNWGARLGFLWNYRDQFGCPKGGGIWLRRCNGSLSTAYAPLRDLRNKYE